MQKFNIFSSLTEGVKLFKTAVTYSTNENNKIRIKDFKIVTEKKTTNYWTLSLYGPDNLPFAIAHPKLGFQSNLWHIKKHSSIAPWFVSELPDWLFIAAMQWWMKFIAYKAWTSDAERAMYYTDLFTQYKFGT